MGEISPTADWEKLADVYYRKHEVYSMCWKNIDLSHYVVAAGKYGGPIALMQDDSKIILVNTTVGTRPVDYPHPLPGSHWLPPLRALAAHGALC